VFLKVAAVTEAVVTRDGQVRAEGRPESPWHWDRMGLNPWPARDEARLVERYGATTAADILPRIRELEDDFYASNARFIVSDLAEMGDMAVLQRHRADRGLLRPTEDYWLSMRGKRRLNHAST
jgi:hypothetical protein